MKTKIRLAILICLIGIAVAACSSGARKHTAAKTIYFHDHSFDVFTVSYPKENIKMYWRDNAGYKMRSFANLSALAGRSKQKLLFATNGGMYMEDNSPLGLYIENGKELGRINLNIKGKGNFYLQPNGIFYLTDSVARVVPTEKYIPFKENILYATQSGPMLVADNVINKAFSKGSTNTTVRSGVAVDAHGHVIFVISNEPVNFYDFAAFFKDNLQCRNALFLDGSVSKMYLPELGRNDLGGDFGVMIGVAK